MSYRRSAICLRLLLGVVPLGSHPALAQDTLFQPVPHTDTEDSLRFGTTIPSFEATDITGRRWRTQDLLGKFTLVDLWSTLATQNPHHRELERFYAQAKHSHSIQVLTFCTDYDYTHASVYMRQRGFTFPVVADWTLREKLFGLAGTLPEQRIIDPEGRVSVPFRYWTFGRIIMEIEKVARNR